MSSPSTTPPVLLTPTLLPLLTHLDIQTLALRTTQSELYTEIEHLSAELQLLHATTTPPIDPQTLAASQNRLALLKKRITNMQGVLKGISDRVGRCENMLAGQTPR
ncbi:uncharacterized protein SPPG_02267 [Spizellomyces punctatus DAOM BR117]|uniref:Biogenesis of lysosome-related organelles complex 1 subunit 7 n=1 Tax=Spizellomyces punctatus (strain DAOM BR117) TaxID=645134 RepID=A0A0L0HP81_SPIPD|nr:uncharacterized protein SPPG_02267 [Spizellomyces punctatus DAOM BR117]KND03211.1 hypothetical protein SPPG_02267 [Spizellomyces punctatus DAOM BR117]|eukprot:XP_016611250.1 hypothetical protein SPPG_02267 [Spizellomyces punctatus DAOM BR117]